MELTKTELILAKALLTQIGQALKPSEKEEESIPSILARIFVPPAATTGERPSFFREAKILTRLLTKAEGKIEVLVAEATPKPLNQKREEPVGDKPFLKPSERQIAPKAAPLARREEEPSPLSTPKQEPDAVSEPKKSSPSLPSVLTRVPQAEREPLSISIKQVLKALQVINTLDPNANRELFRRTMVQLKRDMEELIQAISRGETPSEQKTPFRYAAQPQAPALKKSIPFPFSAPPTKKQDRPAAPLSKAVSKETRPEKELSLPKTVFEKPVKRGEAPQLPIEEGRGVAPSAPLAPVFERTSLPAAPYTPEKPPFEPKKKKKKKKGLWFQKKRLDDDSE